MSGPNVDTSDVPTGKQSDEPLAPFKPGSIQGPTGKARKRRNRAKAAAAKSHLIYDDEDETVCFKDESPARTLRSVSVDPEWYDIESLQSAESYARFTPPTNNFLRTMLNLRDEWAPNVDFNVQAAITGVMHGIVIPRFIDWESWRDHTNHFFRRLCQHRRIVQTDIDQTITTLQERHDVLCRNIETLQKTVKDTRDLLTDTIKTAQANHTEMARMLSKHDEVLVSLSQRTRANEMAIAKGGAQASCGSVSSTPTLAMPHDRGRPRSIERDIFRAQLNAVIARSQSPSRDALRLMANRD